MIVSHFSHLYARWPPPTAVVQELEVAAAMDLHVQPGDDDNVIMVIMIMIMGLH